MGLRTFVSVTPLPKFHTRSATVPCEASVKLAVSGAAPVVGVAVNPARTGGQSAEARFRRPLLALVPARAGNGWVSDTSRAMSCWYVNAGQVVRIRAKAPATNGAANEVPLP